MAIFDSRTLTRTTWRESLKWDAGPTSSFSSSGHSSICWNSSVTGGKELAS